MSGIRMTGAVAIGLALGYLIWGVDWGWTHLGEIRFI